MPASGQEAPRGRRLDLLDYLRLAAALVVVAYHYLVYGVQSDHIDVSLTPLADVAKYGYLGVDLFFLISGFVIMNSARRATPSRFAASRARRLFPAFWPIMLVTAAAIFVAGDRVGLEVTPTQVVANLTMVPTLIGQPAVDGVYWSLAYEILFYALVFLALAVRLGKYLGTLMPVWALGMLAVTVVAPGLAALPFMGGYYAYFALGAILAEVRHDGRWTVLRGAGAVAALAVILPWAVTQSEEVADAQSVSLNPVMVCGLVLVWVALIASMLAPRVARIELPAARSMGALTYPLYLVHANLGYIAMSYVIDDGNKWAVYPATLAVALLLAYGVNQLEGAQWWSRFFNSTIGRATQWLDPKVRPAPKRVAEPTATR